MAPQGGTRQGLRDRSPSPACTSHQGCGGTKGAWALGTGSSRKQTELWRSVCPPSPGLTPTAQRWDPRSEWSEDWVSQWCEGAVWGVKWLQVRGLRLCASVIISIIMTHCPFSAGVLPCLTHSSPPHPWAWLFLSQGHPGLSHQLSWFTMWEVR